MRKHVVLVAAIAVGVVAAWIVWRALAATEGFEAGKGKAAEETIFVSVASYRDADCAATLKSMFANATHPRRVMAGVCEQNTDDLAERCTAEGFEWWDRVRRVTVPAAEAAGPTYARHLCASLYRGEDYFCQIDSHTRFAKGWDVAAVAQLAACPSDKAVLTHYPHDWDSHTKGQSAGESGGAGGGVPVLCKSSFNDEGVPVFEAVTLPAADQPRPVPFTSGGFVFGPGAMVREVPFDPDLPQLFHGEEITYSARLWTSGYDFFTPTTNLVFHHYYREEAPKYWDDDARAAQKRQQAAASVAKVKKLLTGKMGRYAYGMGSARTLDQYWEFAGLDWGTRTSTSEAKFC